MAGKGSMRAVDPRKLSRRDFAKTSALAAAAAALLPGTKLAAQETPASDGPKLPPGSAAEAEARYQMILARRGSRLSLAQKAEVRKAVMGLQQTLDHMRALALENADEPALQLLPRPPRGK
jgi:hypothetical protein